MTRESTRVHELLRFEQLVSEISALFLDGPSESFVNALRKALQRVAVFLGADRAVAYSLEESTSIFHLLGYWLLESDAAPPERINISHYPWAVNRLLGGEALCVPDAEALPLEGAGMKSAFEAWRIRAILEVPIRTRGTVLGYLIFISPRGRQKWCENIPSRLDVIGDIIAGALQRWRTQLALTESQEHYMPAAHTNGIGVWDWNLQTDEIYVDPHIRTLAGIRPDETVDRVDAWYARMHPDDVAMVRQTIEQHIIGRSPMIEVEWPIIHPDGSSRWFLTRGTAIRDSNGDVMRVTGTVTHITERRKAEEQIRYQAGLLQPVSNAVISFDPDFRFVSCNAATISMFGKTEHDMRGRRLGDVIPSDFHGDIDMKTAALAARATGHWSGEIWRRLGDGRLMHVDITVSALRDSDEMISGFVLVARDVSDRVRLEFEVQDVSRRERERIGQDLHDGLGASLTGASLMVRGQAQRARGGKPILPETLDEIADVLADCSLQTGLLARGLCPVREEERGLERALQELATFVQRSSGVACEFEGDDHYSHLEQATATQLFRIAQEAVNNAMRHAGATTIKIVLKDSPDEVKLTVSDDGKGLPETKETSRGFGLRSLQYRARAIGATLTASGSPRQGTAITCSLSRSGQGAP